MKGSMEKSQMSILIYMYVLRRIYGKKIEFHKLH